MPDINLIQNKSVNSSSQRTAQIVVVRIFVGILVLAAAYFAFLLVSLQVTNKALADQTAITEKNRQAIDKNPARNELVTHQGQLHDLNIILQKHPYWSQLFPELARVMLKTAAISNLDVNIDGTAKMQAVVPNYTELDKLIQVFDLPEFNTYFHNIVIDTVTKSQQGSNIKVGAQLSSEFIKDLLKKKTTAQQ